MEFMLTSGNTYDPTVAVELLSRIALEDRHVLGDKAYGTNNILNYLQENDADYTIPPRTCTVRPWFCDQHIYKYRHVIECFFQKLKWFRRIATRYDKLDSVYLVHIHLAACSILLR